jgi:hypothetical protein
MYEHVVHAFDDAVTVHPDVLTVRVTPISIDPNAISAPHRRLGQRCLARRRWRLVGGGSRLGLLHHDDRLAVDLLGNALFDFDDDVFWSAIGLYDFCIVPALGPRIAIMLDFEGVARRTAVVTRSSVILGRSRKRPCENGHPCAKSPKPRNKRHLHIIRS